MRSAILDFLENDSGATAIEYGMIAALVSVVIIASVKSIGTKLSVAFDKINTTLP